MKYFKRVTSGVVARIDEAVREIENHDALIQSALGDLRKRTALANVHLGRLQRDGKDLQARLSKTRSDHGLWRERARECRDTDEARAMECLRRSKRAESLAHSLEEREQRHQEAEAKLTAEVRHLGERNQELQERLRLMRARATCAEAGALMSDLEGGAHMEIEDTFDRWESKVAVAEYRVVGPVMEDSLAGEFEAAEEDAALRIELEALDEVVRDLEADGPSGEEK